jgi:hypothetical protein
MRAINKKTMVRKSRLQSAKIWIETYNGKNFVKGYSNKYKVDKLCALKELRLLGVELSETHDVQINKSLEDLMNKRQLAKLKKEEDLNSGFKLDSDDEFAFIIGYTSGRSSYGIRHNEINDLNNKK